MFPVQDKTSTKVRKEVKGTFTLEDALRLDNRKAMEFALEQISKGVFNF